MCCCISQTQTTLRVTSVAMGHILMLQFNNVWLAAWRSGNGVGRINEVTLRRARLALGWVTCLGLTPGGGTLFRYVTSHPG